jgi:uncharacterized phage infection (PIP) family protein YhgE
MSLSYEPRMRGKRFRRPGAKKSAKNKRDERTATSFYQEPEQIDPLKVSTNILNAIEHLGNQRFALPPFSEHFQRWMNDVKTVLTEFESQLPKALNQQYRENTQKTLANLQETLTQRINTERKISSELTDLNKKQEHVDFELSKIEHAYKSQVREIRRRHEMATGKLQQEIDSLDKQRLKMLREKSNVFQRFFRRSGSKLEEKTGAIESRRAALGGRQEAFKHELEKYRTEFEAKRKQLIVEQSSLRMQLESAKANNSDDALEVRKLACEELHRTIAEAVEAVIEQPAEESAT